MNVVLSPMQMQSDTRLANAVRSWHNVEHGNYGRAVQVNRRPMKKGYGMAMPTAIVGLVATAANPLLAAPAIMATGLASVYELFSGSGWGPQATGSTPATVVTVAPGPVGYDPSGGPYRNVSGVDPTTTQLPSPPKDPDASKLPGWVVPVGIGVVLLALSGGAAALIVKKKRKASVSL